MTATQIALNRLQVLYVSLSNSCALFTYFGIPRKNSLSQNLIQKGDLELDALDSKGGNRQFLVSCDGSVPFILATKLAYSKEAITTVLNHALVSKGNDPLCKGCPVSRDSEGCFGKKVVEFRNGLL